MAWLKTQFDIVLFVVLAAIFLIWPEIDLWISTLFYSPEQGFIYRDNAVVLSIYELFRHAPKFILPLLLIMTALSFIKGRFGLGSDQRVFNVGLIDWPGYFGALGSERKLG